MKFNEYLRSRNESVTAFARRSGVPATTAQRVADGGVPTITTCYLIVKASQKQRAKGGGSVSYDDLVPDSARKSA